MNNKRKRGKCSDCKNVKVLHPGAAVLGAHLCYLCVAKRDTADRERGRNTPTTE
jgi:hypothetical protein